VLKIEVLDVSLAGRLEPWRAPVDDTSHHATGHLAQHQAALSGCSRDGQVVASGEETVADNELPGAVESLSGRVPLSFEKRMLDDWFASDWSSIGQHPVEDQLSGRAGINFSMRRSGTSQLSGHRNVKLQAPAGSRRNPSAIATMYSTGEILPFEVGADRLGQQRVGTVRVNHAGPAG